MYLVARYLIRIIMCSEKFAIYPFAGDYAYTEQIVDFN